jgi:hypothetical protein
MMNSIKICKQELKFLGWADLLLVGVGSGLCTLTAWTTLKENCILTWGPVPKPV